MRLGRPQRWERDPRAGWLAAFGIAFAVGFAVVAGLLASPVANPVDAAVSAWIRYFRYPALTSIALALTLLASAYVVIPATVIASAWLGFTGRMRAAMYVLFSVVPGWLVASVLKLVFHRERPQGVSLVPMPADFSLPSGHTVAAALLYGSLAVVVVFNLDSSAARRTAVTLASVLVTGVALSRVYLGVHWVGDVLAALLFAAAWLSFTTIAYLGSIVEQRRAGATAEPLDR
ncbi:MAG: phosphatase PAP2 family protein [Actinobacteria bacterium]|nr:MAG: phosphatase PAP2 family protein [Actinomycetota bacterium]